MENKENVTKRMLEEMKSAMKVAQESDAPIAEKDIARLNKLFENVEEAASIQAVRYINDLLDAYYRHSGNYEPDQRYFSMGIKDDQELSSVMGRIQTSQMHPNSTILRDQKRQELYERMGFEGKLPTHEEIYALEAAKRNCETKEEEIELEKQIELKKLALAELPGQFDLGLPSRLASDVERKAALETEWAKEAVENKENNTISR